ncbi:hypothetical protein [Bradyrhizobium sp.]|uniref:hypothetical protein n=1 Tax=Bradyrhizobium sp. TaxID=376 RepID=UPI0039C85FB9
MIQINRCRLGIGLSGTFTADSGELEGIALAGKRSLRLAASPGLMRRAQAADHSVAAALPSEGDVERVRLSVGFGPKLTPLISFHESLHDNILPQDGPRS